MRNLGLLTVALALFACCKDAAPDAMGSFAGTYANGAGNGGGGAPASPIALDTERFPPGTCKRDSIQLEGTLAGNPFEMSGSGSNDELVARRPFYTFNTGFF